MTRRQVGVEIEFSGIPIEDAVRTVDHLAMGGWKSLALETAASIVHVSPVGNDAIVAVAAKRGAPVGWVIRTALHAVALSTRFVEAYA